MLPIVSLLFILCTSLVVTRLATVALTLTGIPRQMAKFQARSAFSGAGFTTSESEQIVNHPVRRKIAQSLMLWGNIGIVSVLCSMFFSAVHCHDWTAWHWGLLIGGIIGFYLLATNKLVERGMVRGFRTLLKRFSSIQVSRGARLLHLNFLYGVELIDSSETDALIGKQIGSIRSKHPSVTVLGVQHNGGDFLGEPDDTYVVKKGDCLILFGHVDAVHAFYADLGVRNGWGGVAAKSEAGCDEADEREAVSTA